MNVPGKVISAETLYIMLPAIVSGDRLGSLEVFLGTKRRECCTRAPALGRNKPYWGAIALVAL